MVVVGECLSVDFPLISSIYTMPNKTHTTAVVLIPPENVQPPIQAIRRIHDRNFERWMPHITLLYPFAARRDFTEITPALTKAAQQITSFSIELTRFDAFKHRKSCTMFLVPEPEDEIGQLHKHAITTPSRLRRHRTICRWVPSSPLRRTIPASISADRAAASPNRMAAGSV